MPTSTPQYATRAEFENRPSSFRERLVVLGLALVVAAVVGIYLIQNLAANAK